MGFEIEKIQGFRCNCSDCALKIFNTRCKHIYTSRNNALRHASNCAMRLENKSCATCEHYRGKIYQFPLIGTKDANGDIITEEQINQIGFCDLHRNFISGSNNNAMSCYACKDYKLHSKYLCIKRFSESEEI